MADFITKDGEVAWASAKVRRILYYFMLDTHEKIMEHFSDLSISPYNPNAHWEGQGDMERSIHETIVNNAGGREVFVRFFYLYYARFVEIAVQGGMPYTPLPAMEAMEPIARPDGMSRKAKPFLHSEIRRRVAKTITRIGKIYTYAGAASMIWAVDDPKNRDLHSLNEKSLANLAAELGIKD